MDFEWDEEKARANLRKHGVSFEYAVKGFKDPLGVEWSDERENYGEARTILLAMADGVILVVAFAERNDRIRIISARRATRREQDHYYRENDA